MIGVPLGSTNWWENCVDQDGNPVHIMTKAEMLEAMWTPEYEAAIDRMAKELSRRLNETLTEMGKNL
jgi:hypothetical protein